MPVQVTLPEGLKTVATAPERVKVRGGRTFVSRRLFGTDGVRGIANVEPMTSETALRLGRALAHVSKRSPRRHKILIGKDTRLSGYMLETAMASGICSMGVDVLLVGPLPTPGIAFLTRTLRADAGVVISASHNPFQDNGIKFFSPAGFKLPDELEAEIEHLVLSDSIDTLRPTATEIGKAFRIDDAVGRYNVFAKNTLPAPPDARRPDDRDRLRRTAPRYRVGARGARGARRARHPARRRARTARTSTCDAGALHPETPRRAPCARPAPTSASRSTATPTAASSSTSAATSSTATRSWRILATELHARGAARAATRWSRP